MNKYLEKIALNALKARNVAKAIGLVSDHTTNWKWALRKLKDRSGNPLSGDNLEKAKMSLGSMGNKNYQKVKDFQNQVDKQVGNRDTEIYGVFDKHHISINKGGDGHAPSIYRSENERYFHTHPNTKEEISARYKGYEGKNIPRFVMPSGLEYHARVPGSTINSGADAAILHPKKLRSHTIETDHVLELNINNPDVPKEKVMDYLAKDPRNKSHKTLVNYMDDSDIRSIGHTSEINHFTPQVFRHPTGLNSTQTTHIANHNIVAPHIGYEGIHRQVTAKTGLGTRHLLKNRSIIFKHE